MSSRFPTGVNVPSPARASQRTISEARICPPAAVAQRRAASMTGVPKQSSPSKITSPALIPIRTSDGAAPERLWRPIACWIATAAATASDAPAKVAMIPSPSPLTTEPLLASTAWDSS